MFKTNLDNKIISHLKEKRAGRRNREAGWVKGTVFPSSYLQRYGHRGELVGHWRTCGGPGQHRVLGPVALNSTPKGLK